MHPNTDVCFVRASIEIRALYFAINLNLSNFARPPQSVKTHFVGGLRYASRAFIYTGRIDITDKPSLLSPTPDLQMENMLEFRGGELVLAKW